MRAFIFSIWSSVGESSDLVVDALKALAGKHYEVLGQGGRQIISASVQGKQFTYEIPQGQTSADVTQTAYEAWKSVKTGGASGGQMTDTELETYLLDATGEVTNTTRARFTRYAKGSHGQLTD